MTRFRRMTARYFSLASCGHQVWPGDVLGRDPQTHDTRCAVCMARIGEREGRERQAAANERMKVA